jgi:hypothetical protein
LQSPTADRVPVTQRPSCPALTQDMDAKLNAMQAF